MKTIYAKFSLLSILFSMLLLVGCERPPIEAVQHGYRGTAMDLIYNPRTLAAKYIRVSWCNMVLNSPQIPIIDYGSSY